MAGDWSTLEKKDLLGFDNTEKNFILLFLLHSFRLVISNSNQRLKWTRRSYERRAISQILSRSWRIKKSKRRTSWWTSPIFNIFRIIVYLYSIGIFYCVSQSREYLSRPFWAFNVNIHKAVLRFCNCFKEPLFISLFFRTLCSSFCLKWQFHCAF